MENLGPFATQYHYLRIAREFAAVNQHRAMQHDQGQCVSRGTLNVAA
jgi:hypothetical protein